MTSESGNRFRGSDMRPQKKSKDRSEPDLDRELEDLPQTLRWRDLDAADRGRAVCLCDPGPRR